MICPRFRPRELRLDLPLVESYRPKPGKHMALVCHYEKHGYVEAVGADPHRVYLTVPFACTTSYSAYVFSNAQHLIDQTGI